MAFEFRRDVRSRQLGQTHFHIRIIRDCALSVWYRHFAVFYENDFRGRFEQYRFEQIGLVSAGRFVVDVALGEWQERQGLGQCQWREHTHLTLLSDDWFRLFVRLVSFR